MYDEIAKHYDAYFSKSAASYELDVNGIIKLSELDISKKNNIIDYGCGTGSHAKFILEKTNWDITCFDISEKMINEAKVKLFNYGDRVQYYTRLEDLQSEAFDLAYSMFFVINHISIRDDIELLARTMSAVVKKGRKFIFDAYNPFLVACDPPRDYQKTTRNGSKCAEVKTLSNNDG